MDLVFIFFSSLGIGLTGALMPGPMLSVTVAESYKRGFWAGPVMVCGHAVPELIVAILFTSVLKGFDKNTLAIGLTSVIGGAFLVWLAADIFLEVRRGVTVDLSSKREVGWGPFFAGIRTSVSNPGWIIWWATIGATYILKSWKHGVPGLVFFFTGHILADFIWYSLVSFLVSRGRGRISDRVYHVVLVVCSLMVLGFAVLFIATGIIKLAGG